MTSNETERTTERWLCQGQRLAKGNKLAHVWQDDRAEEHWFAKFRGAPGRYYDVTVIRTDDDVRVFGDPTYVESMPTDDPRRIQYEAADRAARTDKDIARMVANDARRSALMDLCQPLQAEYRKQVGPDRKAAFLAVVIEMVTR